MEREDRAVALQRGFKLQLLEALLIRGHHCLLVLLHQLQGRHFRIRKGLGDGLLCCRGMESGGAECGGSVEPLGKICPRGQTAVEVSTGCRRCGRLCSRHSKPWGCQPPKDRYKSPPPPPRPPPFR